jgi:hypothetical protein
MSNYESEDQDSKNLPATVDDDTAIANIAAILQSEGGDEYLKYKKKGGVIVPLGTQFVAHVTQMKHGYVRFSDEGDLVERHVVPMGNGQQPPDRSELSNPELEGTENDRYLFQYYLPMEELETGDILVFVTHTSGGKIALNKLMQKVAREKLGLPTIALAVGEFPTKNFGMVPCPKFKIVGWEINDDAIIPPSGNGPKSSLNDTIPF